MENKITVGFTDPKNAKQKRFIEILQHQYETYIKKNADYGDGISKSIQKRGYISGFVRIEDKFNRLENLLFNENLQVKDETISDTISDMINYLIILQLEIENNVTASGYKLDKENHINKSYIKPRINYELYFDE